MTDAPKIMWRETVRPCAQYREGGSFYHETKPEPRGTSRKELIPYVRADLPTPVAAICAHGIERVKVLVNGLGAYAGGADLARISELKTILSQVNVTPAPVVAHSDDRAVDRFAVAMKAKLADARAKGRSGWDDPDKCPTSYLIELLYGHLPKGNEGNFEDIANLCMMLHQRGAHPKELSEGIALPPASAAQPDAVQEAVKDFLAEFTAHNFEEVRNFSGPSPADELESTTEHAPVVAFQEDAQALLEKAFPKRCKGGDIDAFNGDCLWCGAPLGGICEDTALKEQTND